MAQCTIKIYFSLCLILLHHLNKSTADIPIVINTWNFPEAAKAVWSIMEKEPISALDAVTLGCSTCEDVQCDHAVGYGGTPDENGETTLDAMIFDGKTFDMGAVGGLRRVKSAMKVARHVFEYTKHSFIVGDLATEFALKMNFTEESLTTNYSQNLHEQWKASKCQPNFWRNVEPDPTKNCGPYTPIVSGNDQQQDTLFKGHDTIGMIAIDRDGNVVAGTSTNGLMHKIPGRVGDSPLPGAGAYADNDVGAAVATGDGDIMMRFLPTFVAVEEMKRGATPAEAARTAVNRIAAKYPNFFGAVLVSNKNGDFAAACNGMESFPYYVGSKGEKGVVLKTQACNVLT